MELEILLSKLLLAFGQGGYGAIPYGIGSYGPGIGYGYPGPYGFPGTVSDFSCILIDLLAFHIIILTPLSTTIKTF